MNGRFPERSLWVPTVLSAVDVSDMPFSVVGFELAGRALRVSYPTGGAGGTTTITQVWKGQLAQWVYESITGVTPFLCS